MFLESDAADLQRHADNIDIAKCMTNRFPHPYTLQDANAWIERNEQDYTEWMRNPQGTPPYNFAICDKQSDKLIGAIGFKLPDQTDIHALSWEIGYWLSEEYWGKGITTEAVDAFTKWAWKGGTTESQTPAVPVRNDLHRIWAGVYDGNAASARVLERCGYKFEGKLRDHFVKDIWNHGKPSDLLIYGMTRNDLTVE